ncbi:MAG: hypothetical protein QXR74_07125 [Candidatus Bathyarchaeia archaeon]
MKRSLSFRFLAVLILSLVLLIFQFLIQIENGLSTNTLFKLPSDVKIELTRCLQGLSREGWNQQLVDIANGILMNESYGAEAWNDFFLEYFETNPFNNRLEEYLGYPLFWWHHETHKQLQEGIYPALMRNIERLSFDPELLLVEDKIETYKNSLEYLRRISSNDLGDVEQTTKLEILDRIKISTRNTLNFILANITLDLQFDLEISFAKISGLNQLLKIFCNIEQQIQDPTFFDEEALYLFAKRIVEENKQVFNQDFIYDKNTQAKASLMREQIKLYLVGFLDTIDPKKDEISRLLGLKGERELIWRELTILTLDNNKFSDYQLNSLYQLMKAIPEELRIVRSVSLLYHVGNVPEFDLYSKLPRFNTVEWEGVTYYEYNPEGSEDFTMATAHEWGHQLDAHYISRSALSERRDQLIRQAGYEQLNYIRSEAEFLQKNPQEFIASICNAYFANTRWVFDLGLERLKMGFKEPLNQFLFFAEIFSLGRNITPFFLIDRYGNVSVTQVQIYRDNNKRINSVVMEQTLYEFTLDDEGNVLSCSIVDLQTDKNPPYTTHNYDELWHISDFIITLTAVDNESRVAETYYRINNEPIKAVSVDGHPIITTENANNTLEYWSVDAAGNEEPHKILTGIKLDKSAPIIGEIRRQPDGDVEPDQPVKILVNATDTLSGIKNVTLLYNVGDSPVWINISMALNTTSGLYEGIIAGQQANTLVKFRVVAYDYAGNSATLDGTEPYCAYQVIPEYPSVTIILTLIAIATLITIILSKRKRLGHTKQA